jgi:hypothetical protein
VVIETLMTPAPDEAASTIPLARRVAEPWSMLFTLTEKMLAPGATPANGRPSACLSLAAMMAATSVPWPTQSCAPVPVRSMGVISRPDS